jgi:hypothetical protein
MVSPENKWYDGGPVGSVAVTGLDQGLTDGAVLVLNDAICPQVVSQNANMMDTVPVSKPVKHSDIGGAVVCDDFLDGTPPAEDFFE